MADAKYKKKKKTEDGETVYEYSDKQVQHRNREKAKRVEKLDKSIGDLRKKVKNDLKDDSQATRLMALAVGVIDETYGRVGNEESAKDGHFGVTVWKKEHITFSGNSATIKYVGKSGVKQEKKVDDAALVKALKDAVEGKDKGDFVFDCTDDDENKTCIRAKDVNEYLKPFDITAKDLRGYHANKLMQDALKAVRKDGKSLPEDKKEREEMLKKEFKKALEDVAKDVGHEAATLKSNYLVPALEDTFMKDGTVTKKLDKKKSASVIARDIRLASSVASRYVNAGTFKAPPAFLNDILSFFTHKYAGHILARTQRRIEALREAGDKIDYRAFRDRMYADYQEIAKGWLGDWDVLDKSFDKPSEASMTLLPDGRGIHMVMDGGMVTFTYTQDGRPKGREYGPYKASAMGKRLYKAINDAYQQLNKMDKADTGSGEDGSLVDLVLLQEHLSKLTSKAREYKTTAKFQTHVDLTGWPYAKDVSPAASSAIFAQKMLDASWGQITVELHFKSHVRRGGVWKPADLTLQVDMSRDAQTLDQFKENMFEIQRIARHEAQHVGQSALTLLKELDDVAGLPSKDIRDDKYGPYDRRQEHALRDVEFHTRMQDEVDSAKKLLRKYQREDWKDILRLWAGIGKPEVTEALIQKYGEERELSGRTFFVSLKKAQPEKWRRAVKEYVSQVL